MKPMKPHLALGFILCVMAVAVTLGMIVQASLPVVRGVFP